MPTLVVKASALLIPIIYLGFISLGLPDGTLGAAWPKLHKDLAISIGFAGPLVTIATLLSAVSGFSSVRVIQRFRTAPVVIGSCVLTGSALIITSQAQGIIWLLIAMVPLGLGAGAVDAGLNGYVARHYSGRHMNWLHACWGIGATCGPLVMARAITTEAGWRGGYLVLGLAQLTLALLFLVTLRLWAAVPERPLSSGHADLRERSKPLATANSFAGWLSAVILALYVAGEFTAGIWAASVLVEARGFSIRTAGICAAAFYASITIGRILVGFVVDRFGNRKLVTAGCSLAFAAALLFVFASSLPLAAASLILLGLGLAPIYPCMMHEVPQRFVPEAVQTVIGRQSGAANLGSATVPAIAGLLATISVQLVPWVIVVAIVLLALSIRTLNRLT